MREDLNFQTTFTPEASETIFYEALCNGLDYFQGYGVLLEYDPNEYKESKAKLTDPCYEDVLIQMLRDGYQLNFTDYANNDESLNRTITLKEIHENVSNTPFRNLSNILEENNDADDADAVIQTVLYGEIIFG